MNLDREQVAKAYQTALRVSRAQFFEVNTSLPVSLTDSAHIPYLGWVGKNYRGGTVLIAKNPGGGGDSQVETTELDARVIARLKALRDSEAANASGLLDELTDAYLDFKGEAHRVMGTVECLLQGNQAHRRASQRGS